MVFYRTQNGSYIPNPQPGPAEKKAFIFRYYTMKRTEMPAELPSITLHTDIYQN